MGNVRCVGSRRTRTSVRQVTRGQARSRTAGGPDSLSFGPMPPFVVTRDSSLPPDEAWARIVDWPQHARFVPFTTIVVTTPPPTGPRTVFNARTGLGRFAFDDPME